jgi:hypothetical protein
MEIFGLNISLGKAKETPAPTEQKDFHGFRAVNTEGLDLSKPLLTITIVAHCDLWNLANPIFTLRF